ncbi:hypothetical protein C8F01DRAFT_1252101 [Mycena amicta]|nr:hypothetical protein C8F01DRAFT_1252101 [Mycena amicta]
MPYEVCLSGPISASTNIAHSLLSPTTCYHSKIVDTHLLTRSGRSSHILLQPWARPMP